MVNFAAALISYFCYVDTHTDISRSSTLFMDSFGFRVVRSPVNDRTSVIFVNENENENGENEKITNSLTTTKTKTKK